MSAASLPTASPWLGPFTGAVPGAALLVAREGGILLAEARGLANLGASEPCSIRANFRLASLTKSFTAMAILILAERRRLNLDQPLSNYLPPWPGPAGAATLRQLLTHTAGLWDFEDLIPPGQTVQLTDLDVLHLVRARAETYFPPGREFRYSNAGYVLLGLIVAAASGRSFPDFLRSEIFAPLGMASSGFAQDASSLSHRALGYTVSPHGATLTDQDSTSATLGDGGIYSSVSDLFLWDQALDGERLVSSATLQAAFTPWSKTSDFPGCGYGFGWYLEPRHGVPCQWHYGSTCGFSSRIERYPQRRLTVILLANRRGADLAAIARDVVDAFW